MDRALADTNFLDRVQSSFNIEDMTETRLKDWLYHGDEAEHEISKGKGRTELTRGQPLTPQTTALAGRLAETKDIYDLINATSNLDGLNAIDISKIAVHRDTISKAYEERRDERARDIFTNVGVSGNSLNKVIAAVKRNDYDLTALRYHSFEVRGRRRIGIWEVGKRGFIANVEEPVPELEEETPPFDTGEE